MAPTCDIWVANHGSLVQVFLASPAAKQWVANHVDVPLHMWMGPDSFCLEARYARDVLLGMTADGLTLG